MAHTSSMSCRHCITSQKLGHSRCFWCACSFSSGRAPTEEEQRETTRRPVLANLPPVVPKRTPAELDAIVLQAIRTKYKPLDEFTQDQLAERSGLAVCACKHALDRLATRRVIAPVGQVKIKWKRIRVVWQVLVQAEHVAPKAEPLPADQRTVPQHSLI